MKREDCTSNTEELPLANQAKLLRWVGVMLVSEHRKRPNRACDAYISTFEFSELAAHANINESTSTTKHHYTHKPVNTKYSTSKRKV